MENKENTIIEEVRNDEELIEQTNEKQPNTEEPIKDEPIFEGGFSINEDEGEVPKPSFLKANGKKLAIICATMLVIIGGIIGIITISNTIKANKIKQQLQGMVFEYYEEDRAFTAGDYYFWEIESYAFNGNTHTITSWAVNLGRLNMTDKLDEIIHNETKLDTRVKISLFGKVTLNNYTEIKIENNEIKALVSGGNSYVAVENSNIDDILSEKGVHETFDSIRDETIYTWNGNISSKIDLPTTDELIDIFEKNFTLSNIKQESDKVTFKVSTGESIFGFTNSSDKVKTFQVFVSGSSINSLLSEQYHFYPVCHFLTNIKGKTVTVDEVVEILLSVEPTPKTSSVSQSATWIVKKEEIQYELVLTEYSTNNYCTMDIYARIQ